MKNIELKIMLMENIDDYLQEANSQDDGTCAFLNDDGVSVRYSYSDVPKTPTLIQKLLNYVINLLQSAIKSRKRIGAFIKKI